MILRERNGRQFNFRKCGAFFRVQENAETEQGGDGSECFRKHFYVINLAISDSRVRVKIDIYILL